MDDIVTELQILHQNILDMYLGKIPAKEKWTNISKYMHDNNAILVKAYMTIKKTDNYGKIELLLIILEMTNKIVLCQHNYLFFVEFL